MKKDGHTHTEFCPHGADDDVELYIKQAIEQGFDQYAVTEHAPLPIGFAAAAGGEREIVATAGMALADVDYYLKKMQLLKHKYASDIKIEIGFEVDYLADFESWTRDFLNEYGTQLDDGILSVHFMPGIAGYRAIDYSAAEYETGLIAHYGSFSETRTAYFETLAASVTADLGPFKPTRIGHMTLCQKFQHAFAADTAFSEVAVREATALLEQIKQQDYQLDYNAAGLFKPDCRETYPPQAIVSAAQKLAIPLVYGSDAHKASEVGRGY